MTESWGHTHLRNSRFIEGMEARMRSAGAREQQRGNLNHGEATECFPFLYSCSTQTTVSHSNIFTLDVSIKLFSSYFTNTAPFLKQIVSSGK